MKVEEVLHYCSRCDSSRVMLQADFKPPKVYVTCKDCGHNGPMIPCDNKYPTTDEIIMAIQAWNKENRAK